MPVHTYKPDYTLPPGVTLKEILEDRGMSQAELAVRAGLTEKTINLIIKGTAPISYETASKFEMALGSPASYWNSREAQYRSALLNQEEKGRLAQMADWVKKFPFNEIVSRGYIEDTKDKGEMAHRLLAFFGVSSIEAWNEIWLKPQLQFRGSSAHDTRPEYVAAWVRMGEIAAADIYCSPYNATTFQSTIKELRGLTILPASEWMPKLTLSCANAGVAVCLVKEIPRAAVSGVAKWLSKDKAVIMLSLKYKKDDQFWFSLFHEVCHILKHSKKTVFYEYEKSNDPLEVEADQFARDLLIHPQHAGKLPFLKNKSQIRSFAAEIGVSPGIVVGRLQHDKLLHRSWCNDLKRTYKWAE